MLVRPETIKQINAILTIKQLVEDSGISSAEFSIINLEDKEVEEIAKEYNVDLNKPTENHPQYWCRVRLGKSGIVIMGYRKRVQFFDI